MSNAIALPDDYAAKLMAGIAQSRAATKIGGFGGKDLLRLSDANGTWVFGQNNEDVQKGSRWAVNPMSIKHGWTCWVDRGKQNKLEGDVMVPVTEPLPEDPGPIEGQPHKATRSFDLKCLDGSDKGTEVHYKINSDGGIRATDALLAKIYNQVATDKLHPCAVLVLESESYWHPKWNKNIHKPVFTLVGWANMNGELAGDQPALPLESAPAAAPAPAKPSKAAKPPLEAAQGVAEPVSTVQVRVGQRRRPAPR